MRVAVFGTGGVGGYFGGLLAQAGEEVTFIARGEHLQAIRKDGLRVDSIKGDFVIPSAHATDDPAEVGVVDLVLLGVKAWQVPEAAQAMRSLVGPETLVLPLQNGVEASSQLAKVLSPRHVLGGAGYIAPNDKITLAGIGTGGQGSQNMVRLHRFDEIQVVAVCDVNREGGGYLSWNWSQGKGLRLSGREPVLGPSLRT